MEDWYPGFEKKIVDQLKGSNIKDFVITSYSIHYTKLYES